MILFIQLCIHFLLIFTQIFFAIFNASFIILSKISIFFHFLRIFLTHFFNRAANRIGLEHSREKRRKLRNNAATKMQSRVRKYLSTMHVMRLAQEIYRKYVTTENEDEYYW